MNHPALDMTKVRDQLDRLAAQLRTESEQSRDQRATVTLDQTTTGRLSRMDAMQAQAMAQAAERRRTQRLARIASARQRIEDGLFGECIECGEWIAQARLALDPTALKCIDCAT